MKGFLADDFSGVPFVGTVTPDAVQKQYDAAVAGLGDVKPNVTVADASRGAATTPRPRRRCTGPGRSARAGATRPRRRCVTHDDGDAWQVAWKDDVVEPSLAGGRHPRRDHASPPRARRHPRPARRRAWSPSGRWCASASTGSRSARPRRPTRPGAWRSSSASTPRRTSSRSRPPAARRSSQAIVFRQDEVPPGVTERLHRHQGRRRDRRRAPAGDHQGVRRADPRHGRPGDRRDDQGQPGRLLGRRRRRAVRPPGAVRRAAARHARRQASTPSARTARRRELFRDDAGGRAAAAADAGAAAAAAGRADPRERRPGQRDRRDQAVDRRDRGRGERARATTATTTRRTAGSRRARPSRRSARWRCSSRGRRRRRRSTARRA